MSEKDLSRRRLFQQGLAAATAATIVPRYVLGGPGQIAPSDTIGHAVVGVGGMGRGHLGYAKRNAGSRLVAVCDVDANRLAAAVKSGGAGCKGFRDFREVLALKDVDVVHVPTPPHWHGLISIAAAEAGKDIWCEKPMTRTIAEGQRVVEAVQRNGRIFRINTWFRMNSGLYGFGSPAKPVRHLVTSGLLGWPLTAHVGPASGFGWKLRSWSGKTHLPPQPVPPELDYDMWLGPAPVKPYHRHRSHGSFRGYWDYDGGGLGDMGQHYIDPVQYILGKDDTSPVEVWADAPQPAHPDAALPWGKVVLTYADGCKIVLQSNEWGERAPANQPYLEGPKGKLYRGFRTDPPGLARKMLACPEPEPMLTDFFKAVRTRKKFALNEANAHRSCTLVNLAIIAVRLGRKLRFDPVAQRFIGDDQANRLVDVPMRAPWHL